MFCVTSTVVLPELCTLLIAWHLLLVILILYCAVSFSKRQRYILLSQVVPVLFLSMLFLQENVSLIKEINDLRQELRVANAHVHDLQSALRLYKKKKSIQDTGE